MSISQKCQELFMAADKFSCWQSKSSICDSKTIPFDICPNESRFLLKLSENTIRDRLDKMSFCFGGQKILVVFCAGLNNDIHCSTEGAKEAT